MANFFRDLLCASPFFSTSLFMIASYFIGIKTNIITDRIKTRRNAVLEFIRQVDTECDFIRMMRREGNRDDAFCIQTVTSAYRHAINVLSKRKVSRLDLAWEQYQSQIAQAYESDHILGYRNHLIAHSELTTLSGLAKQHWL